MSNTPKPFSLSPNEDAEIRYVELTTKSKVEARRCRMVLLRHEGRPVAEIAHVLGVRPKAVYTALRRYRALGTPGLRDDRCYREPTKATRQVRDRLLAYLDQRPRRYGWARPTWTAELMARQLQNDLEIHLSPSYLARVLKQEKCRRGRPRPCVHKPVPEKAQTLGRLELIVKAAAPACEVLYLDEVDIHLNPKLGLMWMKRGQQIEVETPGQNVKYYIAGALNARTGTLTYVHGMKKDTSLFLALLDELGRRYRRSSILHLILDNYGVHKARRVDLALGRLNGRVALHFLPAYSPEHNPIERLWKQMHDEVTRNHTHTSMRSLWLDVVHFLDCVQPFPGTQTSTRRIAA